MKASYPQTITEIERIVVTEEKLRGEKVGLLWFAKNMGLMPLG